MLIRNRGEKTTAIYQEQSVVFDMKGSSLTLEGTLFTVDLLSPQMRTFQAEIVSGYIRLLNASFDSVRVTTDDAPILVSASADARMNIDSAVQLQQDSNNICLISSKPSVGTQKWSGTNRCNRPCSNVTEQVRLSKKELQEGGLSPTAVVFRNVTSVECKWECSSMSSYTLLPYTKNPDPSVRARNVELYSKTGEIQYSTLPLSRLPPYSGRSPLDRIMVLDGLEESRQLAVPAPVAAVLNNDFRPGGANRPAQDFFIFNLQGPSRPAGFFVWTSDIRYLVLRREHLAVLSLGLLVPSSFTATVSVSPSECPFFDLDPAYQPDPLPLEALAFEGKLHPYAAEQLDAKYNKPPVSGSGGRRSDAGAGGEASQRRQMEAVEQNSKYVRKAFQVLYLLCPVCARACVCIVCVCARACVRECLCVCALTYFSTRYSTTPSMAIPYP